MAFKTLDLNVDDLPGRDSLVPRLLRDARAAAILEHPNIVAIYDVFEERCWRFVRSAGRSSRLDHRKYPVPSVSEPAPSQRSSDLPQGARLPRNIESTLTPALRSYPQKRTFLFGREEDISIWR
ncbi:hypothetical protein SBA3_670008 [Candidatus Sulfopaludibacter sp. SbA3]|nr:hypothetical protein SBA3_670008 [Candidatus Sulfopaludibacter sp. SbA3]